MIRAPKVRTEALGVKKPEILGRRPLAILGGDALFPEPLYVTRPRVPDTTLFGDLLARVFNSHWFTNDGPLLKQLEERLRLHLGVEFCAAFCNGTIALQAALRSLDLSGEVITTPFTFPATVHAIEWNGLTPVFCDVDRESYNLDPAKAAELVTSRTSAILPVHVFGEPCDVIGIHRMAEERGLKVVYDAAHAFGVSYQGKPIGCWGDLSILSFHATKLFHTCEGGAVVGLQKTQLPSLTLLRNFGIVDEDEVRGVGLNGKMSELHAAMGLCMLDLVDREIEARGRLAARYRAGLCAVDGLTSQRVAAQTTPNYAYQTLEVDPERFGLSRDELHLALRAENIITRRYFYPLCSENESYRHLPSAQPSRLPNAHRLAARILCLPLYGELTPEEVDGIVGCIVAIKEAAPRVRRALGASRR